MSEIDATADDRWVAAFHAQIQEAGRELYEALRDNRYREGMESEMAYRIIDDLPEHLYPEAGWGLRHQLVTTTFSDLLDEVAPQTYDLFDRVTADLGVLIRHQGGDDQALRWLVVRAIDEESKAIEHSRWLASAKARAYPAGNSKSAALTGFRLS